MDNDGEETDQKINLDMVKKENGVYYIDIEYPIDKYELLSCVYYNKTVSVMKEINIGSNQNTANRYFDDKTICHYCGNPGHMARNCKDAGEKACFYCGMQHRGSRCQYILCYNCNMLGHISKHCRTHIKSQELCRDCKIQRHWKNECPKKWRKYYIMGPAKENKKIQCGFCCQYEHYLDDCSLKLYGTSVFSSGFNVYVSRDQNANTEAENHSFKKDKLRNTQTSNEHRRYRRKRG